MRRLRTIAAVWLVASMTAGRAAAQEPRLAMRFDAATADSLDSVIASAAAAGLPAEPLVQKALEGAAKGATPARVVGAVRALAARLATARDALGPAASESELVSGASALWVGVDPATLVRLRSARPEGSLAMALAALTFLVNRGMPADASVRWVESLAEANIATADWLRVQRLIDADIRAGASAAEAGPARMQSLLRGRAGPGG